MPDIDYTALFGADDSAAQNQAAALARVIGQRKAGATLGLATGDPAMGAVGKQLNSDAADLQNTAQQAGQFRGLHGQAFRELAQANNPNSPMSQLGPQLAKELGLNVPPGTPYSAYSSMLPEAVKALQASQGKFSHLTDGYGNIFNQNTRTGEIKLVHRASNGPGPNANGPGPLKPKDVEDQFNNLTKAVSTTQGRGNLNKENQQRLYNAERLEALVLGPGGDIQNLPPQQVREAATALAALISNGGSQAVSQIDELVPQTLASEWASKKSKFLNEPQGAEAQAFLRNMIDTSAREKKVVTKQIRAGQIQALPNYAHLAQINPTRYRSILSGAGLNPEEIDQNGLSKAPPQEASAVKGPVRIASDAEFDALPSGTEFIAPDGKHRRKP